MQFPDDAKGTLPGGKTFDGIDGLREILLARKDQFCRCLAEKMLTYALGRGLEDYDDVRLIRSRYAVLCRQLSVFEFDDCSG